MLGFKRVSYWQRCANPESRADVAEAKHSIFFTKKAAFGMYKSAEEHTKLSGSLSLWVYTFPFIIMVTGYLMFYVQKRYDRKIHPEKYVEHPVRQTASQPQSLSSPQGSYSAQTMQQQYVQQQTTSAPQPPQRKKISEDDFKPDIAEQPWTAPAYDGMNRNYRSMPYPVACIKSADKCTCYTDQATPMLEIKKATCIKYAEHGVFNPYKQRSAEQQAAQTAQTMPQNAEPTNQVTQLDGEVRPSLSPTNSGSLKNIR